MLSAGALGPALQWQLWKRQDNTGAERDMSLMPLMSLPQFHLWLNQKLSDSFPLSQSSFQSQVPNVRKDKVPPSQTICLKIKSYAEKRSQCWSGVPGTCLGSVDSTGST